MAPSAKQEGSNNNNNHGNNNKNNKNNNSNNNNNDAEEEEDTFDPWAGKKLGKVTMPEGYEEYVQQNLRGKSLANLGNLEEAMAMTAEYELEREQVGGSSASGPGRGKQGKGGGKVRGRFQRYNVVERPPPRARPSHFAAIRLYSKMIHRNVQQMQQWFIEKDPLFAKCIVPVRKIHTSLLLTTIPQDRRDDARAACAEAGAAIREILEDQPVKLTCSGVSNFGGQVLFTRIRTEPHEMLQVIHDCLAKAFMKFGFPVLDESSKNWLDEGEEPHDFRAHATFLKVSKAMAHANDREKKFFRNLRVTTDDMEAWKDIFFGTQLCYDFELLDMVGTTRDGYYPCIQQEAFNDRPMGPEQRPAGSAAHVPLMAGPLRLGRLRVECGEAGAGLQLSACEGGFLVESMSDWPGQPDIREGDVIVAIGGELLHELSPENLEEKFRQHFANGASILVGNWEVLQKTSRKILARAADRLLNPFKRASNTALLPEADDGASDATSISAYTAGGTKLRGRRFQLRSSAPSYTPDPLSQPGGDPWAVAAEKGYEMPAYTGWGTEFKNKIVKHIVDSSMFQRKGPRPQYDADGACLDVERTRLHEKIRQALQRAWTHNAVLEVASRWQKMLSLTNRANALAKLCACGFLVEDARTDPRLRDLLLDLEDDLEAVLEADATLEPALLGNLALSLGRLNLRRPQLFRNIASVVHKTGIWTFSEFEVAGLLEGFSRARLVDEALFQDASRLLVARLPNMMALKLSASASASAANTVEQQAEHCEDGEATTAAARATIASSSNENSFALASAAAALTTMLVAYSSSNVATEQLFFSAGDVVVATHEDFSSSQLADLAEAFARVKARHPFLLDLVPMQFPIDKCKDKKFCRVDALVHLFAAYVDERQEFGPEGYREELAEALIERSGELSLRAMRQILQAAARARWPHAALVEMSVEVAKRDRGKSKWEIDAIHDCFAQLRVAVPPNFPPRIVELRKRRGEKGGSKGEEGGGGEGEGVAGVDTKEQEEAWRLLSDCFHFGSLRVDGEDGAGLEMSVGEAGFYVEEVFDSPGQTSLREKDVVVAIQGRILAGLQEDEVERAFGAAFADGALLLICRCPEELLGGIRPECVASVAARKLAYHQKKEEEAYAAKPPNNNSNNNNNNADNQGGAEQRTTKKDKEGQARSMNNEGPGKGASSGKGKCKKQDQVDSGKSFDHNDATPPKDPWAVAAKDLLERKAASKAKGGSKASSSSHAAEARQAQEQHAQNNEDDGDGEPNREVDVKATKKAGKKGKNKEKGEKTRRQQQQQQRRLGGNEGEDDDEGEEENEEEEDKEEEDKEEKKKGFTKVVSGLVQPVNLSGKGQGKAKGTHRKAAVAANRSLAKQEETESSHRAVWTAAEEQQWWWGQSEPASSKKKPKKKSKVWEEGESWEAAWEEEEEQADSQAHPVVWSRHSYYPMRRGQPQDSEKRIWRPKASVK